MKPSEKLRKLRESFGRSPNEVAAAIGISNAEYYDLEGFDDLEDCLDLGKIRSLASLLGIRSAALFSEGSFDQITSPTELASLVMKMVADRKIALSQAEEEMGWALSPFLQNPNSAILGWNITCLRDVCTPLGCSWIAVLDGIDAAHVRQP